MDFLLSQNNLYIVLIALISGGMLLWPVLGKGGANATQVGLQEAVQLANQKHGIFLDVRPVEHFKGGTIPQARNVPANDIDSKANTLPKDKPIIVFCDQGRDSSRIAKLLRKQGFAEAFSLQGGLRTWSEAGMPLSKKGQA